MNREIKFRFWNKNGKYMVFDLYGSGSLNTALIENEFIIMQFTGLKDKNGKDIYEGDILATSNNNTEYYVWDKEDKGYTVVKIDDKNGLQLIFSDWNIDFDEESIYSIEFIEIIGNIFENPELLERIK